MTLYKWSQTASVDATADPTINWTEGQAPSSVNDSARAMMAAIAKYRDDVAGAIVTSGTSTAYTVSTYQVFQSLSQMNGQVVAFTPHVTNTAGSPNVTLNVDGLGAKTIRADPASELPAGVLVAGTPYTAIYNSGTGIFYLQNVFGNPYNIPIGAGIDYWGSTAPNSSFVLAYGQAISRATYSTLFSLFGTTYGTGDGSSTFNIPDLRGRVTAKKGDMGGSDAGRLTSGNFGSNPGGLGSAGGSETKALVTANLPPYTPSGSVSGTVASLYVQMHSPATTGTIVSGQVSAAITGGTDIGNQSVTVGGSSVSATFTGTAQGGTSTPFVTVQPTIICNYIIRII